MLRLTPLSARGYYMLGITIERQKRIPEAMTAYQHSVDLDPRNVDSLTSLATLYLYNGDTGRVIELLHRAATIDPNHPSVQVLKSDLQKMGVKVGE